MIAARPVGETWYPRHRLPDAPPVASPATMLEAILLLSL